MKASPLEHCLKFMTTINASRRVSDSICVDVCRDQPATKLLSNECYLTSVWSEKGGVIPQIPDSVAFLEVPLSRFLTMKHEN